MKKYAFAVEIDSAAGIYEIFDVVSVPDTLPAVQENWATAFSLGVPSIIPISGVSGISAGDEYANGVFTNNSEVNSLVLSDDIVAFAIVSASTVYGFVSMEKVSFNAEKYLAATQEPTIVIDANEIPGAVTGAFWNGSDIVSS